MRLIDADKLILYLNDYALHASPFRGERAEAYNAIKQCIEAVEEQPTAYDIDKVVEELEKLADESYKAYCIAFNSDDRAEYDAYTNAIEIVKQGGVSDDVCEWECKYINDKYSYSTSCGNIFIYETNSVYCPYCGKKIKVVE